MGPMPDELIFHQLLAGEDFAAGDQFATTMRNHVYVIGDSVTRQALLVDPAYDVPAVLSWLADADLRLGGVLATHYHADHVGGSLFGHDIAGVTDLLEKTSVPIHVQRAESPWVVRAAGVSKDDLVEHEADDVLEVGDIRIRMLHTPGHTPGSQCFLVDGRLVAGDTLFLNGCGRTDLPGSDPAAMYDSLLNRLGRLPDDTVVYPGHLYSEDPSGTLGDTKRWNPVLTPRSAEEWLRAFGG
jgi:glyoxylase-like metal-dependent hydrolase (beta-lactamase superfamily II)